MKQVAYTFFFSLSLPLPVCIILLFNQTLNQDNAIQYIKQLLDLLFLILYVICWMRSSVFSFPALQHRQNSFRILFICLDFLVLEGNKYCYLLNRKLGNVLLYALGGSCQYAITHVIWIWFWIDKKLKFIKIILCFWQLSDNTKY